MPYPLSSGGQSGSNLPAHKHQARFSARGASVSAQPTHSLAQSQRRARQPKHASVGQYLCNHLLSRVERAWPGTQSHERIRRLTPRPKQIPQWFPLLPQLRIYCSSRPCRTMFHTFSRHRRPLALQVLNDLLRPRLSLLLSVQSPIQGGVPQTIPRVLRVDAFNLKEMLDAKQTSRRSD